MNRQMNIVNAIQLQLYYIFRTFIILFRLNTQQNERFDTQTNKIEKYKCMKM